MKTTVYIAVLAAFAVAGCATKTRSVELAGMYASDSGSVAIGKVDIMATPSGEESAFVKYVEDNAWLCPSMKLRSIKVMLTGTNSCARADELVGSICQAFVESHGTIAKSDASAAKVYAAQVAARSASSAAKGCADGSCSEPATESPECADGACSEGVE